MAMRWMFALLLTISHSALAGSIAMARLADGPQAEKTNNPVTHACMYGLWKSFLPYIANSKGYIEASDVERSAGVKMQHVADVAPMDTIASYDQNSHVEPWSSKPSSLSIRLETQITPSSFWMPNYKSSWQVMQGRSMAISGKTSVLDFSCMSSGQELSLEEVEKDLQSIGFMRVGSIGYAQHAEFFDNQKEPGIQVVVYFDVPPESVSTVNSIHIVGSKIIQPNKH
jgi:hypothetical protein